MKPKELSNSQRTFTRLTAIALLVGFATLFGGRSSVTDSDVTTTAHAQTDFALQRRVDMIEQRFYMMESRLNSLEQQSRYQSSTSPSSSVRTDSELSSLRTQLELMRAQMDTLNRRLADVECGLLKVDERTLTQAARDMRRRGREDENEPCRLNPSTAIRLSSR
jgi:uncharacterized coiled-coil protein SlyX